MKTVQFLGDVSIKKKSNLHYTRDITPKRVASSGIHLRGLVPGHHSSEASRQRWQAVGVTVSDRPGIQTPAELTARKHSLVILA